MQIAQDHVVSIHYTLTNDQGETLDSSLERGDPLTYLHGHGNIIPGLEEALLGKVSGDQLDVTVEPSDGYGERVEELIQEVPRSAFQGAEELVPGMQFQAQTDAGTRVFTITAVSGDNVTVDGNHPLAGERLHFSVEVTDIRPSTEEELAHGHVHDGSEPHH